MTIESNWEKKKQKERELQEKITELIKSVVPDAKTFSGGAFMCLGDYPIPGEDRKAKFVLGVDSLNIGWDKFVLRPSGTEPTNKEDLQTLADLLIAEGVQVRLDDSYTHSSPQSSPVKTPLDELDLAFNKARPLPWERYDKATRSAESLTPSIPDEFEIREDRDFFYFKHTCGVIIKIGSDYRPSLIAKMINNHFPCEVSK